jgi:hypothetical protein
MSQTNLVFFVSSLPQEFHYRHKKVIQADIPNVNMIHSAKPNQTTPHQTKSPTSINIATDIIRKSLIIGKLSHFQ